MPELPEVETVARELRQNILGRTLKSIDPLWGRSMDVRCDIPLENQSVKSIARKGKYLIVSFTRSFLVIHLRMTGQLLFYTQGLQKPHNHVRIIVTFTDGSQLHFRDMRKFGRFYHVIDPDEIIKNIGMDALDMQMNLHTFRTLLSNSRMNLKAFLLSQYYISGLGNIYVDESLFRSHLHPSDIAASLSKGQSELLFNSIRTVLNEAVENMGSTISDYRDTYGNAGNNQNFFRVYGRVGNPCVECGTMVKKMRFAGRGTYYCPSCQKPEKVKK